MKGRILLTLFALPFAAVGLWAGYSIGSSLWDYRQMQGWTAVQAELTEAGYHSHAGDDSTTYEAYASYRYRVGGQTFTGNRVAIGSGADNIGSFQEDLGRRLATLKGRGERVTVYYNPARPAESILDRSLRPGMLGFKAIFFLLFGGVGAGLGVAAWLKRPPADAGDPKFADEPWTANPDWSADGIRSTSRASMYSAWIFAAVWNLVSAPLPFLLVDEVTEKGNYIALIGLLFPLVGIGLLVFAVRRTAEWRRFGAAPVVLDPYPGAVGGDVGGRVDVRLPFDPNARYEVGLTCVESRISGSGKNRSRREQAHWQDSRTFAPQSGPLGTRIQFLFDVPEGLAESTAIRSGDNYWLWRLSMRADMAGVDFDRDYEIPVYPTSARSASIVARDIGRQASGADSERATALREKLNLGADGRLYQPPGRGLIGGLIGFVTGAGFAIAGAYMVLRAGEFLFGLMFGGIGALAAVASLYALLNSLTVTQEGSRIRSTRRVLGVPISDKTIERAAIRYLDTEKTGSSQTGKRHTVHYRIVASDGAGSRLVLATGLSGAGEARAAAELLKQQFGISIEEGTGTEEDADFDVLAADR